MNRLQEDIPRGIYVHVPFCASTCDYCAFYQEKPKRDDIDLYLKAIEIEVYNSQVDRNIDTIFWGGGTPGLLPAKDLERLAKLMHPYIMDMDSVEWSIEMAPSAVKKDKLQALKDSGVNRISLGVQSFQEKYLERMGRQHSLKQVMKAYELIQEVGFENVNIDFIFAIPGQELAEWEADLNRAFELNPDHISTYCLIFEEDTSLYLQLSAGQMQIDPEVEAQMFELTWQKMNEAGYEQYEVANYAKKSKACQHNLNTWRMYDWMGLGPSAASQWNGKRFTNVASLKTWSEGIFNKGWSDKEDELELTEEDYVSDSFSFGLRMNEGVNLDRLKKRFPTVSLKGIDPVISTLGEEGLLYLNRNTITLSDKGRLLADQIAIEFMNAIDSEK